MQWATAHRDRNHEKRQRRSEENIAENLVSLAREGIHHPADGHGNQEKHQECPQGVLHPFAEVTLAQTGEGYGDDKREQKHDLEVSKAHGSPLPLGFPPVRNFMRIQHEEQVKHPGGGKQARPVVSGGVGNIRPALFDYPGDKVKHALAQISEESQQVEVVTSMADEDVAAQNQSREGK